MAAPGPICKIDQNATESNLINLKHLENFNIKLKPYLGQNFTFFTAASAVYRFYAKIRFYCYTHNTKSTIYIQNYILISFKMFAK